MLLPNYILEGATGCRGQDVIARNDIIIEIKSYTLNVISGNRPTDVIARAFLYVPESTGVYGSGVVGAPTTDSIIEGLRTTSEASSGLMVSRLNQDPINAAYIKSLLAGSGIRNIELVKRPGPDPSNAKILIQFERSTIFTPSYVVVYTNTIGPVDAECNRFTSLLPGDYLPDGDGLDFFNSGSYLGPGVEQVATVFDITEIEVN
jgi:hypothetical protein